MRLISPNININFIGVRHIFYALSILMTIGSFYLLATKSLNFGIDFKGGILIEVKTPDVADVATMRSNIGALHLGDFSLQQFGDDHTVLIRIQAQDGDEQAQQKAVEAVRATLPAGTDYRRVEYVGPTVGGELISAGTWAMTYALLAIMAYIWARFEWPFAVGAIIALIHDVIVTLGFYSLFQIDFNLATVAAILTIAGYSMNDTVIVYDRIRETSRKFKKMPFDQLINRAINNTLSRTTLTSSTTLIALTALYFLGGDVIASFSIAMIFGIVIGTFSSIFIASPILLLTRRVALGGGEESSAAS